MVFITVHAMANQLQIQPGSTDFLEPQIKGIVIRITLIASINRIGFGLISWREGINPSIELCKAKIHIVETTASPVVLNVFPVKLVA